MREPETSMHFQNASRPFEVSWQDVAAFERDGAVCLRKLLLPEEVELLRRGIQANLETPSPRAKIASRPEDPGRFVEDFCNWPQNTCYKRFIFESPAATVAGELMRSDTVRLYHDHMLTKEPGTRERTPWHQDQPYYNIEGRMNCRMWISVDPVDRESSLELVAGSHRGPWLMPRSFMSNEAKWFPEGALADLPDIEAARAEYPIIGWNVEPGDAICFHMLTLHATGGVRGRRPRRVFSIRFVGDDVTDAPRPWTTSPEFPGLAETLSPGVPMDHPLFPVVWRRAGTARTGWESL